MRNLLISSMSLLALVSFGESKQFEIKGNVDGLGDTEFYVMGYTESNDDLVTLISGNVVDSAFMFSGKTEHPYPVFLRFKDRKGEIAAFVEPSILSIHATYDQGIKDVSITGGKVNDFVTQFADIDTELSEYYKNKNDIQQQFTEANKDSENNKELISELRIAYSKNNKKISSRKAVIMEEYFASAADDMIKILLMERFSWPYSFVEKLDILKNIEKKIGETPYLLHVKKRYEHYAKVEINKGKVVVGRDFIDLIAPTQNGTNITLSEVVSSNRLVLLEFWASWCAPCRAEVPNIKSVYDDYHDKGFEVYGISLDSNRGNWLRASKQEKLPWINVSHVKGMQCPSAKKYGIDGIPANFLISNDGTIVAQNLRREKLREKVQGLLGN